MATVKKVKKAQRGGCVSNMTSAQRQRYFQGGPSPLQKAGQAIKDVFTGGKTKEERQEARAERKAARAAKKSAPAAKAGKSIKKAQRGGCVSNMSSGERTNFFRGASEGQIRRANNKQQREVARDARKEARVERRAARKAAPPAKNGTKVKKAQAGKMVPSEMRPGKMIKKADRDARADSMVDALNKQAGKGRYARPMGANLDKKSFDKVPSLDKLKKKIENKKVAPKNMKNGGKAKKMMSGGKCKYGC